ncbi:MAG: DNA-3-methyladenine glycosylase [Actinobacteria bacterium]|nr:DNA-3-methyladenine glycosylase [Actinomycetota bacterium]
MRELGERRPVPRDRLARPALELAPDLLGLLLVRAEEDGTETVVRLAEVEAYHQDDPAAHSFRGPTPSNEVMFGPAGHLYVYFTYGMHHCMNVVCGEEGRGEAVLLRAAVALSGHERVRDRRGPKHAQRDLLRGPGRLTQALAIDRELDGADLTDPGSPVRLEDDGWRPGSVERGPRIGVRDNPDVPWRCWIADVPEVSRYARHPRADGRGS